VLGPVGFTPLSTLWALTFIVGPGLFAPVQQELGRVIGSQRSDRGGGHALRKVVLLAGGFAVGASLVTLAAHEWITQELFAGDSALLWCFVGALWSYALLFIGRGVFSGLGEFADFGWLVATESVVRLAVGGALAVAGARSAAAFGASIAVAPVLSLLVVSRLGRKLRLHAGNPASWGEVTRAMGWLVMGSLLAQSLANAGPLAVQLFASPTQEDRAGRFLSALVVARLALYLFQAVQATLVPDLAQMVARGENQELHAALRRLTLVCLVLIAVTTVGSFLLGSFAVRLVFGAAFTISDFSMAILTAGTGVYVLGLALSSAAIASAGHRLSAIAWLVGFLAFTVVALLVENLFLRVELAYLVGSAAVATTLLVGLPRHLRRHPVS
jgi:O-antigen/teichoic acid export membrane protein